VGGENGGNLHVDTTWLLGYGETQYQLTLSQCPMLGRTFGGSGVSGGGLRQGIGTWADGATRGPAVR